MGHANPDTAGGWAQDGRAGRSLHRKTILLALGSAVLIAGAALAASVLGNSSPTPHSTNSGARRANVGLRGSAHITAPTVGAPNSTTTTLPIPTAPASAAAPQALPKVTTPSKTLPTTAPALNGATSPQPGSAENQGTSNSWAGYVVTGQQFTDVSGSWVVPYVTCDTPGRADAVTWVGMDGIVSSTVEQVGTTSDCGRRGQNMYAWYEMYPADMVTLPSTDAVFAGDTVSASVSVSGSTWNFEITDATQGWAFSTSVIGPAPAPAQESAEWIVEAPTPCSLFSGCSSTPTPLADFTTETFSGAEAVAEGTSGPISAFPSIEETMTGVGGTTVKAQPSALSGEGTSFSVTWANPGP